MPLPYENATSGQAALEDIRKLLTRFGCARFGHMVDLEHGEVLLQFTFRERNVTMKASFRGYAAAWLKEHPHTYRMKSTVTEHERKALAQSQISVYSILRDWIKGQITAIETGMLTFEGAFLGQILLGSGKTVLETVEEGNILPRIEGPK